MIETLVNTSNGAASLHAQTGFSKKYYFELSVTNPDITNEGTIKGKIESYDYKSLYKIYNLNDNDPPSKWAHAYNNDTDLERIIEVNNSAVKVELEVDLTYTIKGSGSPVSIYIFYMTIYLTDSNGDKKSYVVTNPASAHAQDQSGNPYSGFTPVTK